MEKRKFRLVLKDRAAMADETLRQTVFYQVYTIHASVDGVHLLLVYILSDKEVL